MYFPAELLWEFVFQVMARGAARLLVYLIVLHVAKMNRLIVLDKHGSGGDMGLGGHNITIRGPYSISIAHSVFRHLK